MRIDSEMPCFLFNKNEVSRRFRSRKTPILVDEYATYTLPELLQCATASQQMTLEEAAPLRPLLMCGSVKTQLGAILQAWNDDKVPVLFSPHRTSSQHADAWKRLRSNEQGLSPGAEFAEVASVLFTSGSTGIPKGIVHSFANHGIAAESSHRLLPFASGSTWLCSLPLFHIGGLQMFFRALLNGGTLVSHQGRLPEAVLHHRPSHLSLVDKQLQELLSDADATVVLRTADVVLLGGGPLSATTREAALQHNIKIRTTYGATETCAQVVTAKKETPSLLTELLSWRKLRIADDGAIAIAGPQIAIGELRDGEVHQIVDEDGWYITKDRGRIDEEGCLVLLGRLDLQFISGGENVQPESIEHVLQSLPNVVAAVVVPVDDAAFGMRPFAFIEMAKHTKMPAIDEVRTWLSARLARFELPVGCAVLPSAAEKPQRKKLTILAASEMNRMSS